MKKFEYAFSCRYAQKANATMQELADGAEEFGFEFSIKQTSTNTWVLEVNEMDWLYDEQYKEQVESLMDDIAYAIDAAGVPAGEYEVSEC